MPLDRLMPAAGRHPWLTKLADDPGPVLDRLLRGREVVPPYYRADAPDLLASLIAPAPRPDPMRDLLDAALCNWIQVRRAEGPEVRLGYGVGRYAGEVTLALSVVTQLALPLTARHLAVQLHHYDAWAAALDMGPGYAPWWELLRAAAEGQEEADLRPVWLRLAEQAALASDEDQGDRLLTLSLVGMRKRPVPADNPDAARLHAVLEALSTFARLLPETKANKRRFLSQLRAQQRLLPGLPHLWRQASQPLLTGLTRGGVEAPAAGWWRAELKIGDTNKGAAGKMPTLPPPERRERLITAVKAGQLEAVRGDIHALMQAYERYALATGDGYNLVRSASNLAGYLVKSDPALALHLVAQGRQWEPNHAHFWSLWANALAELGWVDQAEIICWEAIRRFPADEVCRNALGQLLVGSGRLAEAETLYKETIQAFPDDAVCVNQYGLLLVDQGREKEAEGMLARLRAMSGAGRELAELSVALKRHADAPPSRGYVPDARGSAPVLPPGLDRVAALMRADFRLGMVADGAGVSCDAVGKLRDAAQDELNRLINADPVDPLARLVQMRAEMSGELGTLGQELLRAFPHEYGLHSLAALREPALLDSLDRDFPGQTPLNACLRLATGQDAAGDACRRAAHLLTGKQRLVDLRQQAAAAILVGLVRRDQGLAQDAVIDHDGAMHWLSHPAHRPHIADVVRRVSLTPAI